MISLTATYVLASLLGAMGIWLMLPRADAGYRAVGALPAAAALGLILSGVPRLGDWLNDCIFGVIALITIAAATAAISCRNPIYSAIWFGLSLLGTAGLFMFQGAQFIAMATVVVYVGAILVTFLFVLMLAQPEGRAHYDRVGWESFVSAVTGVVMVAVLSMTLSSVLAADGAAEAKRGRESFMRSTLRAVPVKDSRPLFVAGGVLTPDHTARIGAELFGRHLIAVEVIGTLLLAALVGAAAIVGRSRGPLAEECTHHAPRDADSSRGA